MSPEEFVTALYRILLDRRAESAGLRYWTEVIQSTGDPTLALKGFLESREYADHLSAIGKPDCKAEAEQALALLQRPIRIVDVGAQSLGAGSHPYDSLLQLPNLEIIGFDPLEERLHERHKQEAHPGLTLLPYAIGDGNVHTFYINEDDANSSLFPLNEKGIAYFNHLSTLRTVRTEQITTRRLDDVLPKGPVDFLKLDVQGAELMVLEGAVRTLEQTAVVHCEVEFSPIYIGQPLFPSVFEYMLAQNFTLIDIPKQDNRYHYLTASGRTTQDRLIWADAVFFRNSEDPETLRSQALIAASVYQKPTLAEHLLAQASLSKASGNV